MANGSVSKKKRAKGLTWIYRFQTTRPSDGARVEHTRVIGLVKDIGTSAAAAWREVGRLCLNNNDGQLGSRPTFRELAEHFREHELMKVSGVGLKASETVDTNELLLDRWILPRWGKKLASEIKPVEIESWFESLASTPLPNTEKPMAWSSITKIKSVMSQVFTHAQRHEMIPAAIDKDGRATNPVLLARSESGSDYEAAVVSPDQMIVLLKELDTPDTRLEWTLALLHAATALRPEEAFGLKWKDIDWKKGQINIRRGWSKGKETAGKNEGSMTQVAMRPAAVKAGVIPKGYRGRFGWHNLRHSLATFFAANEVNLPVIQSMMRHAKPTTTAHYIHRVNAAQMAAQEKFLEAINVTGSSRSNRKPQR